MALRDVLVVGGCGGVFLCWVIGGVNTVIFLRVYDYDSSFCNNLKPDVVPGSCGLLLRGGIVVGYG